MIMFKLSSSVIRTSIKVIGTVALLASEVVIPCMRKKVVKNTTESGTRVNYDNVIAAVVNSNMLSDYKVKVIATIPKDGDNELFKAIIQIISSDMTSTHIIKAIECICAE